MCLGTLSFFCLNNPILNTQIMFFCFLGTNCSSNNALANVNVSMATKANKEVHLEAVKKDNHL